MGARLLEGLNLSQYTQIPHNTWIDRTGITAFDSLSTTGLTPIAVDGANQLIITVDASASSSSGPGIISSLGLVIVLWDERGNPIIALPYNGQVAEEAVGPSYAVTLNHQGQQLPVGITQIGFSYVFGFNILFFTIALNPQQAIVSMLVNLHYKIL